MIGEGEDVAHVDALLARAKLHQANDAATSVSKLGDLQAQVEGRAEPLPCGLWCQAWSGGREVSADAVWRLLNEAKELLPGILECALNECCVAFRPALTDHLPALGPWGPAGVFVTTGHYRHGIKLAPMTASVLVDHISDGRHNDALTTFSPNRFNLQENSHG